MYECMKNNEYPLFISNDIDDYVKRQLNEVAYMFVVQIQCQSSHHII